MLKKTQIMHIFRRGGVSLLAFLMILVLACGGAEAPTAAPADPAADPTAVPRQEPTAGIAATKAMEQKAEPTESPAQVSVESARDTVVIVTNEEPTTLGAASQSCGGNIQNTVCDDIASDPLTWIDSDTFEVVPLQQVDSWEQVDPNRWRFHLREGVTFHNGAPWNAEQAAFWIDFFGDEETSGHGNGNDFSFHGVISGEAVDDLTLDVVCKLACPILPRTVIFTKFQDVGWYQNATPDEIETMTVGLGPYKIVDWKRGIQVELEKNDEYIPNAAPDARAPILQTVIQQWRNEPLVRAAMLEAKEADWAEINLDDVSRAPKYKVATNNEAYVYTMDTVYHPELSKVEVREALNLAIDCEKLMTQLFNNLLKCYGNIAQKGTVGITDENSAPYGYDPARARELLQQANYDPANEIVLSQRSQRVPKDVEYGEAVVSYWREVGVNARLNVVESKVHGDIGRSSCARGRTKTEIYAAPGANLVEKCQSLGVSEPLFTSSNLTAPATSTESLDFSRQAILRNSCFTSGKICEDDLEKMIEIAMATDTGPERTRLMVEIADHVHNHFHFVPNFMNVVVYGLSEYLEWEPNYAPRIRANTMYFTK